MGSYAAVLETGCAIASDLSRVVGRRREPVSMYYATGLKYHGSSDVST
jgi:hypothetical protein